MSRSVGRRRWQPMTKGSMNPQFAEMLAAHGVSTKQIENIEVWGNDIYDAVVRHLQTDEESVGEMLHISFKRRDRAASRDWRHFQQIKNEIAGPERCAVEIFPPESKLVDTSNEYHLWVFPEGIDMGFGFQQSELRTPEQIEEFNEVERSQGRPAKAQQRPWQEGLTTGLARG